MPIIDTEIPNSLFPPTVCGVHSLGTLCHENNLRYFYFFLIILLTKHSIRTLYERKYKFKLWSYIYNAIYIFFIQYSVVCKRGVIVLSCWENLGVTNSKTFDVPLVRRGENAFCSAECRDKHIRSDDDLKENCGFEARKQLDYSASPCSRPQPVFAAGVTVAWTKF